MASHSCSPDPKQIIEGQNLDRQKFLSLLKEVYGTSNEGENNFRVEVRYRFARNNTRDPVLANLLEISS
jgi:hypothetical protein